MCTLALSDIGELRDEWLREPAPKNAAISPLNRACQPTVGASGAEAVPALPTAAALAIAYLGGAPAATVAGHPAPLISR